MKLSLTYRLNFLIKEIYCQHYTTYDEHRTCILYRIWHLLLLFVHGAMGELLLENNHFILKNICFSHNFNSQKKIVPTMAIFFFIVIKVYYFFE